MLDATRTTTTLEPFLPSYQLQPTIQSLIVLDYAVLPDSHFRVWSSEASAFVEMTSSRQTILQAVMLMKVNATCRAQVCQLIIHLFSKLINGP